MQSQETTLQTDSN